MPVPRRWPTTCGASAAGKPIRARRVSVPERAWKWARRRPLIAALVCGMILSALLGFGGVTWQWQEATWARDDKERERVQAETARAEAVAERQRARVALYFSRIAQSQLQFRVNNVPDAVASLGKCVPAGDEEDRRGWEWYYLYGLFHSDLLTLNHARPAVSGSAAFDPRGRTIVSVLGGHVRDDDAHRGEAAHLGRGDRQAAAARRGAGHGASPGIGAQRQPHRPGHHRRRRADL